MLDGAVDGRVCGLAVELTMAPNPQQTDAASLEVGVVEYHDTALRGRPGGRRSRSSGPLLTWPATTPSGLLLGFRPRSQVWQRVSDGQRRPL